MPVNRRDIISLYRLLMLYGKSLKFTDKQFYYSRIREEFNKHKHLTSPEEISFQYQKGLTFLQNKRIV